MSDGVIFGAGFVGRERALSRLKPVLDTALAGRSALVLLTGEAGIGKSALLFRLVEEAAVPGVTAVWATCWQAEGAPVSGHGSKSCGSLRAGFRVRCSRRCCETGPPETSAPRCTPPPS